MTVTPDTPQTIEGVTVSAPNSAGDRYYVRLGHLVGLWLTADQIERIDGLTVPEPTVPCRIGDTEFTLTREDVSDLARWDAATCGSLALCAVGAAARAHLDAHRANGGAS